MRDFQPYVQQLDDLTFTHGTSQVSQTIQLKQLEKRLYQNKLLAHLVALVFELEGTYTFTTAPTLVGLNSALTTIEFSDGQDILFQGSGNDMRMFERMENGGPPVGEPITQTSTNPRVVTRTLPIGPARFAGSPSDFAMPCAEFNEGGYIKFTPGVLTDISGDTTVGTTVVHTYAVLAGYKNRLRLPAKYQRRSVNNTGSGLTLSDTALYAYLGAVHSQATNGYDGFTAGHFAKIQVSTTSLGRFVPNTHASGLARVYQEQFRRGSFDQVKGEQRNDTFDVAPRIVNFASATALAAQVADLQMFLWAPPDCSMSKLSAECRKGDNLKVEWSGTLGATGGFLFGRFLPHTDTSVDVRIKKSGTALGLSLGKPQPNDLMHPTGNAYNPAYGNFDVAAAG